MEKIKNREDVKKFLDRLKRGRFTYQWLSDNRGSRTILEFNTAKGEYTQSSRGQGWCDQAASALRDPEEFVWGERGKINRALKEGYCWM